MDVQNSENKSPIVTEKKF